MTTTPQQSSASIVIPTMGKGSLAACLGAVCDTTDAEVIIIVNAADAATEATLRRYGERLRPIRNTTNLGVPSSFNQGFAAARGDLLVQMQDDAVPQPGWLDALIESAILHPEYGVVGGVNTDRDGSIVDAGGIVWNDGNTSLWRGDDPTAADVNAVVAVDYHGSAGCLIRRAAWESVGGFDPAYYPAYHSDVDFCTRVRARGWGVGVDRRSRVVHTEHASSTPLRRAFLGERNRARFMTTHATALRHHGDRSEDRADIHREIMRARTKAPFEPPAPASDAELDTLATRLAIAEDDVRRAERELAAAYERWLEERVQVIADERDAAAEDARRLRTVADELERALRNQTDDLRRVHADFAELEAWTHSLNSGHPASTASSAKGWVSAQRRRWRRR